MTLEQLIERMTVLKAGMTRKDEHIRATAYSGLPKDVKDAIRQHQQILVKLCLIVERGPSLQPHPKTPVQQQRIDDKAKRRKAEYAAYLNSEHWAEVRKQALARAQHRCQLCRSNKGLQVHHNNYYYLWRERPQDVIALCRDCHAKHHGKLPA